ncbi:MAG: hypothetical protein HY931_01100 [Candidatus Falkowbacteria bacterium]|nr:MAG: hypothetical protein HY931_01100 [Candidatus Falkowbacteria bacterium]
MFKRIGRHLKWRLEKFYRPNKWHLILDISLITVIVTLIAIVIGLYLYNPKIDLRKINLPNWIAPANPQIDLNNPPLAATVKVLETAIYPDSSLKIEIALENKGDDDVKNLSLDLVINNSYFAIYKIEEVSPQDQIGDYQLNISGTKIMISNLPAGMTASKTLKINFKSDVKSANLINWQANVEYYFYKQLFKNTIPLSDIKVAAKIQARAAVYYNSPQGDQLGSGPLPPVVDLPTDFWVFFKAEPTGDFNNFVMSAKLPDNVSFTDNSSLLAGNLIYNKDTRQVIWKVDSLSAGSDNYRAGFELELVPETKQVGKNALLAGDIRFQAEDIFSGLNDNGKIESLDTSLNEDLVNKGNGQVISE